MISRALFIAPSIALSIALCIAVNNTGLGGNGGSKRTRKRRVDHRICAGNRPHPLPPSLGGQWSCRANENARYGLFDSATPGAISASQASTKRHRLDDLRELA